MEGWIKLLRKFLDWEWFQKPEMVQLFIYLLLKANYAPMRWQGIDIKAGQFVISKTKIRAETGLSEQTIKTCMKRLISTNEITVESTNRYSIITICKYDSYQLEENLTNQLNNQPTNQQATDEQPTSNQQPTDQQPTIIIRKKEREEREEDIILSPKVDSITSPPKGEEVSKPENDGKEVKPSEKKKPLPSKKIADLWNATCTSYPKIFTLSEARKNKIRIRVEEMGGIDKAMPILQTIFKKMQESKFLKGENKRGWKASFDWVFENSKNWVKVWEGNYDEKEAVKSDSGKAKNVNEIWDNQ